MFSKAFMRFLFDCKETDTREDESVKEIEFKPVKVREAAKVVIAAIKDTY